METLFQFFKISQLRAFCKSNTETNSIFFEKNIEFLKMTRNFQN